MLLGRPRDAAALLEQLVEPSSPPSGGADVTKRGAAYAAGGDGWTRREGWGDAPPLDGATATGDWYEGYLAGLRLEHQYVHGLFSEPLHAKIKSTCKSINNKKQ